MIRLHQSVKNEMAVTKALKYGCVTGSQQPSRVSNILNHWANANQKRICHKTIQSVQSAGVIKINPANDARHPGMGTCQFKEI